MVDTTWSGGELLSSTRIARRPFLDAAVGSKHVLMNVEKGIYIGLDPVGKAIWDSLEASRTIATLCDDLQNIYEVSDRTRFEGDVTEFLGILRLHGLVEVVP